MLVWPMRFPEDQRLALIKWADLQENGVSRVGHDGTCDGGDTGKANLGENAPGVPARSETP